MDCQDCNQLLALFMDESLTARERAEVHRHLAECANCRNELELLNRTVSLVNRLPHVEAPAGFERRVLARLESESRSEKSWYFWRTLSLSTVAAAAMVLVTLVVYHPIQTKLDVPAIAPETSDAKASIAMPAERAEGKPQSAGINVNVTKAKHSDLLQTRAAASRRAETNETANKEKTVEAESDAEEVADYSNAPAASMYRPVSSAPVYPVALQERMTAAPAAAGEAMKKAASADAPTLYRQKQEWSGEVCRITSASNQVLRTPDEIAAVWNRARITSVGMPAVDVRRQMLGIVFLGNRAGRGYDIQLRAVESQPNRLVVRYHVAGPDSSQSDQITQPFLAFLLPASPLPVVFAEEP